MKFRYCCRGIWAAGSALLSGIFSQVWRSGMDSASCPLLQETSTWSTVHPYGQGRWINCVDCTVNVSPGLRTYGVKEGACCFQIVQTCYRRQIHEMDRGVQHVVCAPPWTSADPWGLIIYFQCRLAFTGFFRQICHLVAFLSPIALLSLRQITGLLTVEPSYWFSWSSKIK